MDIVFYETDDWKAVYVDGVCMHQGHDIPNYVFLKLLETSGCNVAETYFEPEELEKWGFRFPDSIY